MEVTDSMDYGFGEAGSALFDDVSERFDLRQHEVTLLTEAARVADRLQSLESVIAAEGAMVGDRVHPALIEARNQQAILARLIASLRIPDDVGEVPQRRGAARGSYGIRVVESS